MINRSGLIHWTLSLGERGSCATTLETTAGPKWHASARLAAESPSIELERDSNGLLAEPCCDVSHSVAVKPEANGGRGGRVDSLHDRPALTDERDDYALVALHVPHSCLL